MLLLLLLLAALNGDVCTMSQCGQDCSCQKTVMYCGSDAKFVPPLNPSAIHSLINFAVLTDNCKFSLNDNSTYFPNLTGIRVSPSCKDCIAGDPLKKYYLIGIKRCDNGLLGNY
jgi:hypothetical protein